MKIKLTSLMAGPGGVHQAGEVVDVSEVAGLALVNGGFAVVVVERAAAIETATVEQGEMAVAPEQQVGISTQRGKGSKGRRGASTASTPSAATEASGGQA